MHLILEHVSQHCSLHLLGVIKQHPRKKMTLLCPLCTQSRFETLETLRTRLVRAATQNIPCPICNDVLLGLDKLTIHLFGHTLPPEDMQPSLPSTVNMDDLSFLTSWQSNKRTEQLEIHLDKSGHGSCNNALTGDVYLEIKPRTDTNDEDSVDKENSTRQQLISRDVHSKEKGTRQIENLSPKEPSYQKSDPLLFCQENYEKYINSHLVHKPEPTLPMELTLENLKPDTLQEPPSPPSFIFDGDTGFLLTPKQFSPEDSSPRRSSGEELSQYMAGSLRLEVQQTNNVTNSAMDAPVRHYNIFKTHMEKTADINSESHTTPMNLDQCSDSSLSQQSVKVKQSRKSGQHTQELSQGHIPANTPEITGEMHLNDFVKQQLRRQCIFTQRVEHKSEADELHIESLESMAGLLEDNDTAGEAVGKIEREVHTCRECGKSYRMRGSLVVHTRVAHAGLGLDVPPEPRNFHCTVCSKSFRKEQQLGQHMKTHDGKQWQCETCSKLFTTKYFLKKHQRLHTGEMPYSCETCGKAFTFQQSYHKHLLYHSSDKPHECRQCGRAFKEVSTLQNHQRIHSGEKPFACETCGKCFRQRVSYIVHQRIHTGALPYQCTGCHKRFRYKVSQKSHKCSAHPPGVVVRQPGDLIQRLLQHRNILCHQ